MFIPLYVKCPACNGNRVVYIYDYNNHNTTAPISPRAEVCKKCNGSGYVESDYAIPAQEPNSVVKFTYKDEELQKMKEGWENFESEPE